MSADDFDHTDHDTAAAQHVRPGRARRWLGWSVIGLVAAGGAAAVLAPALHAKPRLPADAQAEADAALAFCATTAVAAQVTPADAPAHRYAAQVPADNPANVLTSTTYSIAQGDVIEFDVVSPRPGQVAVHGLHDLQAVQVGASVSIAFRAIYSGRFPLHFHGADGSHFELAALEVLPASATPTPQPGR